MFNILTKFSSPEGIPLGLGKLLPWESPMGIPMGPSGKGVPLGEEYPTNGRGRWLILS